jgi:hypothetical protein
MQAMMIHVAVFNVSCIAAASLGWLDLAFLAQTGVTKTAIGWVIALLCIGLGLLVMCRPGRKAPDWKKK